MVKCEQLNQTTGDNMQYFSEEIANGIERGVFQAKSAEHNPALLKVINESKINPQLRTKLTELCMACKYNHLLRYAAINGAAPVVQHILEHIPVVNINSRGPASGKTALYCASEKGHMAIVELLLKHDAYVNAVSAELLSPLAAAFANKHYYVAGKLSQHGGAYLSTKSDSLGVDLGDFNHVEATRIRAITQGLDAKIREYNQRPSYTRSFIARFLYSQSESMVISGQQLDFQRDISEILGFLQLAYQNLIDFFDKCNIPIISREDLLKLDTEYRGLPYREITKLLDSTLSNDIGRIAPISHSQYSGFCLIDKTVKKIQEQFSDSFDFRVKAIAGDDVSDDAPLLKWSFSINGTYFSEHDIQDIAQCVQGEIHRGLYQGQVTVSFYHLNKEYAEKFDEIVSRILPQPSVKKAY